MKMKTDTELAQASRFYTHAYKGVTLQQRITIIALSIVHRRRLIAREKAREEKERLYPIFKTVIKQYRKAYFKWLRLETGVSILDEQKAKYIQSCGWEFLGIDNL